MPRVLLSVSHVQLTRSVVMSQEVPERLWYRNNTPTRENINGEDKVSMVLYSSTRSPEQETRDWASI